MKLAASWRLSIALAAIALLAAFAAWPGGSSPTARAALNSISAGDGIFSSGGNEQITVTATDDDGELTVSTTSGTLTLVSCNVPADQGDCSGDVTGSPGTTLTIDTDAIAGSNGTANPLTLVVRLTDTCGSVEAITVDATQGVSSDVDVFCVDDDPHLIVEKDSNDNAEYDFDWDASGGDCLVTADDGTFEFDDAGTFELEDGDNAFFWCETPVRLTVVEDDDADFVEIEDCDEGDEGVDEISGARVEIDISDIDAGDTIFCTWVNDEDFEPTPAVGPVRSVSIVLSTGVIDCGGSTLVQVLPRSAGGGPAPAGTTVTVSSSLGGGFQPTSSLTSAFPVSLANFLYTAPDDVDGVTTITARAGNVQATATVRIDCDEAAPPPTSTPAPLQPPSAGSGGLIGGGPSGGGGDYLPAALAVAAAGAVLGLTAVSRHFAAVPVASIIAEPVSRPAAAPRHRGSLALLFSLALLVIALMSKR